MTTARPPEAKTVPLRRERFGIVWEDPYAWLRDPAYPEVRDPEILAHLEAENAWYRACMAPRRPLVEDLYAELRNRIEEEDRSVPARQGAFEYQWRFDRGAQYRRWYRRPAGGGAFVCILDENALAADRDYFRLRALAVSPDDRLLAFATDEDGSERHIVRVKDLRSGGLLPDRLENCAGDIAWSEDGKSLFYVELDPNLRPFRVRRHRLGDDGAEDAVVYRETDPAFFVSLEKTRDRRFLLIASGTHVTREYRLVDPLPPHRVRLVAERREGHDYRLDHAHGRLWILTNDRHRNFRLVRTSPDAPGEEHWQEVIAGSDERYLLAVDCFARVLVLSERRQGLDTVRVRSYRGEEHCIAFPEEVYTVGLGENREFDTDFLRLRYSSLVTPWSVLDYRFAERRLETRKVQKIPSGYDPSLYLGERRWAISHDGTRVPISILRRRDVPLDGTAPLYLYGYGAYGHGLEPAFGTARLSLVERGVIYAVAHVRGGDELGYRWYEEGRREKKTNSFRDFVACAETLIAEGYTAAGRIGIHGGSAGGMLIGVVLNERPDLWGCAVLEVPFVDVVNTMLDETLPLTPIEWPEWGDPVHDPEALRRLLSYSPYDNVRPQPYPPMLVTAGLSDPRVTYWEPAKYVARLRATRTDDRPLLLKVNMGAGHFGRSGRFEHLRELAEIWTFLLERLGVVPPPRAEGESVNE